jgi:hypothetical protein
MNVLTTISYKIGYVTLGSETWATNAWAWASTYKGNIKSFGGLELKSKKDSVLETPMHSKTRRG